MKTESDLMLEYLKDTGTRAYVESSDEHYCPECEATFKTSYDAVTISKGYYEWLIEKITNKK